MSTPTAAHGALPDGDTLREIARQARNMNGPSDSTSPIEYVLAGWQARAALSPASPALGPNGAADRYFYEQGFEAGKLAATPAQQTQSDAVAGAVSARNYTTQSGDMVAGIALRQLGAESRWTEITALNRRFKDMGPSDCYPVGTVLFIPGATPPQQATPSAAASIKPDVQPMTDEDAKKLIEQSDLLDMFEHIGWYSAPKKNFLKNSMTLIRAIEAAHGIRAALKEAPGGGT